MVVTTDKLLVENADGIAVLILNQPEKRNAISFDMWQGIGDVLESLAGDDDIRALVVSGAGDEAFSAGADISEFKDRRTTPEDREAYDQAMDRAFDRLVNFPKLTIAMIDGVCVGGGAEVAMDCDIAFASDRARFAITPAKLGLGYGLRDVSRLVRHVGPRNAKEILATGHFYNAEQALAMGWVNHVVEAEELADEVLDFAHAVAANAPLTVKAAKLMVNEALKPPQDQDHARCKQLVEDCFQSQDYAEGQAAFAENRKPEFKGG